MDKNLPRLLSEKQLAQEFGFNVKTLQKMRCEGGGPIFIKVGRAIKYDRRDVEAYLTGHKFEAIGHPLVLE